jgi:hypothetical protein
MAMELLCATLTGIFICVFIHYWSSYARQRAIEHAGSLLYEQILPFKKTIFKRILPVIIFILQSIFYGILIIKVSQLSKSSYFAFSWNLIIGQLGFLLASTIVFFFLSIYSLCHKMSFEFRQNGIVSGVIFIAWDRIKFCKLNKSKKKISIRYGYTSYSIKIVPESFDQVIQLLAGFVEIRNYDNNVIAGQCKLNWQNKSIYNSILSCVRRCCHFQFDLRMLLSFVLVCAIIFSWYGIHYQRSIPQQSAIEKFRQFNPQVICIYGDVIMLWFNSKSLPGDDDLGNLKNLTQLVTLSLSESPITDDGFIHLKSLTQLKVLSLSMTQITDSGLVHLAGLKNLNELDLNLTNVTPEGVAKLQKFLPNAKISHSPPPPSRVTPPVQSTNK